MVGRTWATHPILFLQSPTAAQVSKGGGRIDSGKHAQARFSGAAATLRHYSLGPLKGKTTGLKLTGHFPITPGQGHEAGPDCFLR